MWSKLWYTGDSLHFLQLTHCPLFLFRVWSLLIFVFLAFFPLTYDPSYQNFPISNSKIRKKVNVCTKQQSKEDHVSISSFMKVMRHSKMWAVCVYVFVTNHFVSLTTLIFKLRLNYCCCFSIFLSPYLENDSLGRRIPENWEGNIRTYEHQVRYRYKTPSHASQSYLKLCFLYRRMYSLISDLI